MSCSVFRAVSEMGGGMGVRVVGFEQAWPIAQCHGGPVAVRLEGRNRSRRSARCARWPISQCAGAEPGRAAGRRGASSEKSGRCFVVPSRPVARRRRTLAAHCRISSVGASDAPTDRTNRRRLNPHNDLSLARMPAAVKRLFIETQVLICRALYQDGSPVEGRHSATPRLSIAKRCCGSGRRGIRTRPACSASDGASREGASSLPRANVPVGGTNRAAASSPGGRCSVPSREGGTVRLARPGPYQGNPQPRVLGSKREPPGFFVMGDATIPRLYLVARPAGSEWRTRRPSRLSITTLRRLTT
jgi:hypothetical protein